MSDRKSGDELFGHLAAVAAAACLSACPQLLSDEFQLAVSAPEASPDPDADMLLESAESTAPHVVSSAPRDGARGVLPDTEIVLAFSLPMDRGSVEAAYTSSDLPVDEVSFTWSPGDTVLRILPNVPLRTTAGSDAASAPTLTYTFSLSASARDTQGRALTAKRISFSMARAITQTVSAVRDRDLTGNWRSDGAYGVSDCERSDTTFCMGDSVSAGEPSYRGFLSFDLGAAPADRIAISAAQLSWDVDATYGDPFPSLGALQIEHLTFAAIGDAAYFAAPLQERRSISAPLAAGDGASVDVLDALQSDWATRDLSQFRLAFESATDGDGLADVIVCDQSTARLTLTYWRP